MAFVKDSPDLISITVTGSAREWERLQERVFSIIDSIAKRVDDITGISLTSDDDPSPTEVLKDITRIAADWTRAKVEKPTLENAKLRAQIASEFAEAKKRWAEASKAEAEAQEI